MTPFRSPAIGSSEEIFNNKHMTLRNVIERCNGVLKMRFRCLLGERKLRYKPEKVAKIINVCCALHNMCIHNRLPNPEPDSFDHLLLTTDNEVDNLNRTHQLPDETREGARIRHTLMQNFVNNFP
jgi:DDE superfamily endonuclease